MRARARSRGKGVTARVGPAGLELPSAQPGGLRPGPLLLGISPGSRLDLSVNIGSTRLWACVILIPPGGVSFPPIGLSSSVRPGGTFSHL